MSKPPKDVRLNEGAVKKGGVNLKPATPAPEPPKGQGGNSTPKSED